MSSKEKIGFVGVGRLGSNMARRLAEENYKISAIYDVNVEATTGIADELDAEVCNKLSRVTELADVILTVVSDDGAMLRIFDTHTDSLLTNAKGKLFINCATVSPGTHILVEGAAGSVGAEVLEVAIASSIADAREGSLYLMCSGLESVFHRAEPILQKLGSHIRFLGPAGKAAKINALVNLVMNMNTAALAEGLALGDALHLDLTLLREIFSQTGADSRVLKTDGDNMQEREHKCFFSAAHAAKDTGIALELAEKAELDLPLARATKRQYDRMIAGKLGEIDKSGISELTFNLNSAVKEDLT